MPRFTITNNGKRRLPVRHDGGLTNLMPGMSAAYDMADSLAEYYRASGHGVAGDGEPAEGGADERKVTLESLDAAGVLDISDKEHIDLGELDLADDADLATAKLIVTAFRAVYDSGNTDMLRGEAEKLQIDLTGKTAKYDIANAIVAHRGVSA